MRDMKMQVKKPIRPTPDMYFTFQNH